MGESVSMKRISRRGWYAAAGALVALVVAASLATPAVAGSLGRGEAMSMFARSDADVSAAREDLTAAHQAVFDARQRALTAYVESTAGLPDQALSDAREELAAAASLTADATGVHAPALGAVPSLPVSVRPTTVHGVSTRVAENDELVRGYSSETEALREAAEDIATKTEAVESARA
jgi:hypothetical protein